jgi:TonB-linked SusC/RagA family outer membrane protein
MQGFPVQRARGRRQGSRARPLALAAALLLAGWAPAAAQTGSVAGRVTAAGSGQPLAGVQVSVVNTGLSAVTNADGRYTVRGVPARQVALRALRLGLTEQVRTVTVTAGATATLDFSLAEGAVQLAPVVTTATGEQRRVEVGNSTTRVEVGDLVRTGPIASVADLLTARAPGVQVLPGNMTGTGARVRIRGTSSLSLTNDPIYVIDGIRMQSSCGSSSISVGGSVPCRTNDLNPEEIESIDVVKGPSASALYGTAGANGVIVITTKRGRAGRPVWNVYAEQGAVEDHNDYPTAWRAWRTGSTAATNSTRSNNVQCFLRDLATGLCTQDSITAFNLFADPQTSPLATGHRQQFGLQVSGGSEAIRYFASGEWEGETGVLRIPPFDLARLDRQGVELRDEWRHPNAFYRASARVNVSAQLSRTIDVTLTTNYINLDQRLPQTDNNTTGLLSSGFGGPGFKYNTTAAGDTLWGYRAFTPGDIFQETVTQGIDRFIGAVNANWRPLGWLAARGNFGVDYASRVDTDICRFATCADFGTSRQGFKRDNRTGFWIYTADATATATLNPRSWLNARTVVGAAYTRDLFDRNGAFGQYLPPGATQITAGSFFTASEATDETRTFGMFVEEALAIRERLYLTAGVRSDRNSAFGADFKTVLYPKFSASWLLSEESFMPSPGWLSELRLRAAYGASGVQPRTTDAAAYFSTGSAKLDNVETSGLVLNALGNRELKPERSAELELGGDLGFLGDRLRTQLTYYNKVSTDALISRVLPPSLGTNTGTGAPSRVENVGKVRNWGWEWQIDAQPVQLAAFGWDLSVAGSHNSNRLEDLGGEPEIVTSTQNRQRKGYPLNGYWQQPYTYDDANHDGVLALSELTVADSVAFLGYSQPRTEITVHNGIDLFRRGVRISALVDHKGDYMLYNGTERIRCQNRSNCRGLVDPTAPLDEQARALAVTATVSRTQAGFIEPASFWRLRELSLTLNAPQRYARRAGAQTLSLTFTARNVKTWSSYSGLDPESNYGQDDIPNDFQTLPPPSYFTVRLNLGF